MRRVIRFKSKGDFYKAGIHRKNSPLFGLIGLSFEGTPGLSFGSGEDMDIKSIFYIINENQLQYLDEKNINYEMLELKISSIKKKDTNKIFEAAKQKGWIQ